ncbi:MAG TPA: hypothetical protein VHE35_10620, partial [Kofleriaceae bacterium]|nr:hypothetical protein [Kofleriaceae bacterium]
ERVDGFELVVRQEASDERIVIAGWACDVVPKLVQAGRKVRHWWRHEAMLPADEYLAIAKLAGSAITATDVGEQKLVELVDEREG